MRVNMIKKQQITSNKGIYFPLMNQKGLKGYLTPFFAGHLALDHDHYVLEPTSERDLYKPSSRNVMFYIDGKRYDLNGQLEHQQNKAFTYETGYGYQKVTRQEDSVKIETTSFLVSETNTERHLINVTNTGDHAIQFKAISAVELYGRSAENQRDHRHVTSLLNVTHIDHHILTMTPTLHFDETGHHINQLSYGVAFEMQGHKNIGVSPTLDRFIGEGSRMFPLGLDDLVLQGTYYGYETIASFHTETITIKPNTSVTLSLAIGVAEDTHSLKDMLKRALDVETFLVDLEASEALYAPYVNQLSFDLISDEVSQRLKFVSLQPLFRRIMGNSYLPHHDYGKGGRGWRDLWQDLIALNMYYDPNVYDMLYQYFKGVRLDGSNATIIGDQPGAFKADRNAITRVWSDHGAWPLITLLMYIHETGDVAFLLRKQSYFKDHLYGYGSIKKDQKPGFTQYEGTILEHILVQHVVALNHLGEHGYVKLMDADWNDGLDMGHEHAETIAFTMMYVNNVLEIIHLIQALDQDQFELLSPLKDLIFKTMDLQTYFHSDVQDVEWVNKEALISALQSIYDSHMKHLQEAFVEDIFQSYFDHKATLLDIDHTVMLTGQAMALLNRIASLEQAVKLANKTKKVLFDATLGGYKLNSLYDQEKHGFGRAFYFAYGHKENGAVFSHMAMMYAYGLYNYQFNELADEAWTSILYQSMKDDAQVYEGIPEYFNDEGKGKYLYLTGSASWLLFILRKQVFGLNFKFGQLFLEPKLVSSDFIEGKASIHTMIFGQKTTIHYHLETPTNHYHIKSIFANKKELQLPITTHYPEIDVYLGV